MAGNKKKKITTTVGDALPKSSLLHRWACLENSDTPYDVHISTREVRVFRCTKEHTYTICTQKALQCPTCRQEASSRTTDWAVFCAFVRLRAASRRAQVQPRGCWLLDTPLTEAAWQGQEQHLAYVLSRANTETCSLTHEQQIRSICGTQACVRPEHLCVRQTKRHRDTDEPEPVPETYEEWLRWLVPLVGGATPTCVTAPRETLVWEGIRTTDKRLAFYLHQKAQGLLAPSQSLKDWSVRSQDIERLCGSHTCCTGAHLQLNTRVSTTRKAAVTLRSYDELLALCEPVMTKAGCLVPRERKHRQGFYIDGKKRSLIRLVWCWAQGLSIEQSLEPLMRICHTEACCNIKHIEVNETDELLSPVPASSLVAYVTQARQEGLEREHHELSSPCWIAQTRNAQGYGVVWIREQQKWCLLHHLSYQVTYDATGRMGRPQGMVIGHLCDSKCFNPAHLCLWSLSEAAKARASVRLQLSAAARQDIVHSTENLCTLKQRYDKSLRQLKKIKTCATDYSTSKSV